MITINNESEMLAFAAKVAKAIDKGAIIFLHGPLGAGKTTFVRGFLNALGFQDKVKSPTYTLVEPYEVNHKLIYHFDLFRLKQAKELQLMGIADYFDEEVIVLIEWPEKGFPMLPKPDLACYIETIAEQRRIRLETHSAIGESILRRI
jgi:tRNA threonylcarbamoyladenosine biosynthesis protein TsaE